MNGLLWFGIGLGYLAIIIFTLALLTVSKRADEAAAEEWENWVGKEGTE